MDTEIVSVVNLNAGKSKKVGLGVYNLETRVNLPKMPRMSKKQDQFILPKTASSVTLSHQLA